MRWDGYWVLGLEWIIGFRVVVLVLFLGIQFFELVLTNDYLYLLLTLPLRSHMFMFCIHYVYLFPLLTHSIYHS